MVTSLNFPGSTVDKKSLPANAGDGSSIPNPHPHLLKSMLLEPALHKK